MPKQPSLIAKELETASAWLVSAQNRKSSETRGESGKMRGEKDDEGA
jgi:hypothetical protein